MVRDSRKLSNGREGRARGWSPQRVESPHAHLAAAALIISVLMGGDASAEPRESTDLSGSYIALGPLGSAVNVDGSWDGGFGGELSFARINEHRRLEALGISLGGLQFTERTGGRIWADAFLGARLLFGVMTGISAGVTVEVDEVRPGRWGGQGTLWVYSGVMPYFRIGTVQRGGAFVDVGLKIPLPALRW